MKALKIIVIILIIIIGVALVMAVTQPSEGSLESSIVINASPEMIYEEAINIKKMDVWSPWYNIEPSAFSYEGPEEGVGATSKWVSENPDLGVGSLTIIEAVPNESLRTKMVFEGFNGTFNSWLKLTPEGDATKVEWGYDYSELDMVARFFMSMMDINEQMTPMFEKGLEDLRQIVESKPTPEPEIMEEEIAMDSLAIEE
ncbi:MAG: SRPBCC family protein [Fulvivirga sp.]